MNPFTAPGPLKTWEQAGLRLIGKCSVVNDSSSTTLSEGSEQCETGRTDLHVGA